MIVSAFSLVVYFWTLLVLDALIDWFDFGTFGIPDSCAFWTSRVWTFRVGEVLFLQFAFFFLALGVWGSLVFAMLGRGAHRLPPWCHPPPFPLRILATLFSVLVRRWDSSAPFGVLLVNNNICLIQGIWNPIGKTHTKWIPAPGN